MKTIDRIFRQHDEAPAGVESPLYRQLTQEWAGLHALASTSTTVRRWGRIEPALAGFQRPGDILDAIDLAPNDSKDAILLALIRLFQAGHQLAGRTVLQALLPKLATFLTSARLCTSSRDSWAEDRRHITVAEFWDVMGSYQTGRRTSSIASNLALDTLHRVSGVRRPADDVPIDPHDFRPVDGIVGRRSARRTWLGALGTTDERTVDNGELTADADLHQVITWGISKGVITRDEAELLTESYPSTKSRGFGYGFAAAAARRGLTDAAVRQRCSRSARKLTDAVRTEMLTDMDTTTRAVIQVA